MKTPRCIKPTFNSSQLYFVTGVHRGGRGGTMWKGRISTNAFPSVPGEGSASRYKPASFYIPLLTECFLSYTFHRKYYPFHITALYRPLKKTSCSNLSTHKKDVPEFNHKKSLHPL